MEKPLITIDKWSGMSDNGGIYYSDGFMVENVGGNSCISEEIRPFSLVNSATTNFTNIGTTKSICSYEDPYGYNNLLLLNEGGKFFKYEQGGDYNGILHSIPSSGDTSYAYHPSVNRMISGNFVYSTCNGMGVGYYGLAESTSGTTKIVDTAGRNFATLGVVVGDSTHNKVTNLETGAEYTVTSITTTSTTNDTLNFSASGVLTNAHNDQFIVWIDDKVDLGTSYTAGSVQYREIEPYGDYHLMTFNGYLATLGSDEVTGDDDFKELPTNSTALYLSVNGSKILVASELEGRGQLLLWDGFSDGWNNILEIDGIAYTLAKYKNGWLYMVNNTLYFTDGWTIQKISDYPDKSYASSSLELTPAFNGMVVYNNQVFIANSVSNFCRNYFSLVVFNFDYGWFGFPNMSAGSSTRLGYSNGETIFSEKISSNIATLVGSSNNLTQYSSNPEYSTAYLNRSFIQLIALDRPIQIKEIALNISHNLKEILDTNHISDDTTITVNVGDAHKGIFSRAQVKAGSTASSINIAGNTWKYMEVGNEIQIFRNSSSETTATDGERSYITAITNQGTSSEAWTISPALSGSPTENSNIKIINVKKSDTRTVSIDDLNQPVRFNVDGFYSDKIFVEVVVTGGTNAFPISIFNLQIYGN